MNIHVARRRTHVADVSQQDNLPVVNIQVFESERPMTKDNRLLGNLEFGVCREESAVVFNDLCDVVSIVIMISQIWLKFIVSSICEGVLSKMKTSFSAFVYFSAGH